MKALVLEKAGKLSFRDISVEETMGPQDVCIGIRNVGICGSDVHYFTHGAIGPFVVKEPMILGHEGSGEILEVGSEVKDLRVGDRVCMEPGVPDLTSRASRQGLYNLDPAVRFWATPPIHGILRPSVVHPAAFTYKLPDRVSFAEGALVEPLAIGMHAATKAGIKPGDVAVVIGAGTIGMVTILAALAGGCSCVIVIDLKQPKLDMTIDFGAVIPVNALKQDPSEVVRKLTDGWGADLVFEASGSEKAASGLFDLLCPGGRVVYIGMPAGGIVPLDIVAAQAKEARIDTIFRYANMYPRALNLLGSGKIDLRPIVSETFPFQDAVRAFDFAVDPKPNSVKIQIELDRS